MRRFAFPVAVVGLLWSFHTSASAQSITASSTSVSIPFAASDYDSATGAAQITKTSAHTLSVSAKGNVSWTVQVRAQTSSFSFTASSGDSNPSKPAGDLAVRAPNSSLTWIPLTTSNQVLWKGSGNSGARAVDYRLNSNLNTDPPGTYTISVIYTVTSP
jgi:hypothetical protein